MNQRIQELIKQSKMSLWEPPDPTSLVSQVTHPGNYAIFSDRFLEKFAELLLKDVAQFVEDKFDFCGDEIIIAEAVLKHFGVEE